MENKNIIYRCKYCGKEFCNKGGCVAHEKHFCNKNLNKERIDYSNNHKPSKEGGWTCPKCGQNFRTKEKLYDHKRAVHPNSKEGGWTCVCGQNFRTRAELKNHKKECTYKVNAHAQEKTEGICRFCGKKMSTTKSGFTLHEKTCLKNPNRKHIKRKPLSEEHKMKISENMKKAHAEGRAGCWKSREKCPHSYPENWFIAVLDQRFNMKEGKDYVCELSFHKQFLDFAWIDKKLCVEIDGEQHHRFKERELKDQRKDLLLKEEGWTEIRADWDYIYNNKEKFINDFKIIYDSIGSSNVSFDKYSFEGHRAKDIEAKKKKVETLSKAGQIDALGRANLSVTPTKELESWRKLILNSGVDLNKFGYVSKLEKATGLSKRRIRKTILKYNIEHFERNV